MVETRSLKVSRLGDMTMDWELIPLGESVREEAFVGGAVTSCAGISAAFVCTCSSKQIYPVSIPSDFLAGEVSNHLGLSPDSLSMFFAVHP